MTLGLALTLVATAWLGATTGVAALFSSAVPLSHRRESSRTSSHQTSQTSPTTRRPTSAEDDDSRER